MENADSVSSSAPQRLFQKFVSFKSNRPTKVTPWKIDPKSPAFTHTHTSTREHKHTDVHTHALTYRSKHTRAHASTREHTREYKHTGAHNSSIWPQRPTRTAAAYSSKIPQQFVLVCDVTQESPHDETSFVTSKGVAVDQ